MRLRSGYDAPQREGSRRQSQQDRIGRQAGPLQGLLLGVPALHLPRRRQGQERDRGQLVRAAGTCHRPDRRRAERPAAGPRRPGGHHYPVPASRARRRRARHGRELGLPALLGPASRRRDLALALIISRVSQPGSKLSTLTWWNDNTLGADLGVAGASTDDIYAAMDWLEHRKDAIEAEAQARPEPGAIGGIVERGRQISLGEIVVVPLVFGDQPRPADAMPCDRVHFTYRRGFRGHDSAPRNSRSHWTAPTSESR